MAWGPRQLPSGLWACTVRLPNGKRVTQTHQIKGEIVKWATDLEADIGRGDWSDPRAGRRVGEIRWWLDRSKDS